MYFDESAWVALGFIIFIGLVWRKVGTALGSLLDSRAQKIQEELSEAENLRSEAEAELRRLKILQNEAEEDAKQIVADARATADRIQSAAVEKAEVAIKIREAQATAKIAAAEDAVITDLRTKATSIAIAASKEVLAAELNSELGSSIIDDSLSQIESLK
tara:strand:- start:1732 stop:2211 length:480 start_codon:yes stop_codon:yes gene_type:complete